MAMEMMARNGEKKERKKVLKSQIAYERAANPAEKADVANGNIDVIGGEVRPRGCATDAMVGETRVPGRFGDG
jgi:hypothetical protein